MPPSASKAGREAKITTRNGDAKGRRAEASRPSTEPRSTAANRLSPLWLAFLPVLGTALVSLLPRIYDSAVVAWSFRAAAGILLLLLIFLRAQVKGTGRRLTYEFKPRPVHYVQLVMHSCVYAYWGWYWREVYHAIPLIVGQIIFAYGLDMILNWFRRDHYVLGFGAFPIVLSTNLFLWFRDDYFYWQFVLIGVGVLGKEFIKWRREGRMTHIFNPSALSLFVFSIALLATKSTGMTWGVEISSTFHNPPHIYMELFLLGLIVQALFGVTLVTLASAAALVVLNLVYTHVTGVYYFIDSNIPVAVFLGLHLLVTDPATSPRRNFGKIIFGALYGVGVFVAYSVLNRFGAPEFYDKLVCVPILNLMVQRLDRISDVLGTKFREWGATWKLGARATNFACMGVWTVLFTGMMTTGFLKKGSEFPGGRPEFWQQACEEHKWHACMTWQRVLYDSCEDGSRNACYTLGQIAEDGRLVPRDLAAAGVAYGRACDMGLTQGCGSLIQFAMGDGKNALLKSCDSGDGASCFILGTLHTNGMGVQKDPRQAFTLFQKSCEVGWWRGCGRLGLSYLVGEGTRADPVKAIENFDKGCDGGNAASCYQVAELYQKGVTGISDSGMASRRMQQACKLGLRIACSSSQ